MKRILKDECGDFESDEQGEVKSTSPYLYLGKIVLLIRLNFSNAGRGFPTGGPAG